MLKVLDILREIKKLKGKEAFKEIRIQHDLTRSQRKDTRELVAEAKKMEADLSGNYIYRDKEKKTDGDGYVSVNKFKIFSNVDVFSQDKISELKLRLEEATEKPSIIALQEVKPKNTKFERLLAEYDIDGYEIIEKNVINAPEGRGLLIGGEARGRVLDLIFADSDDIVDDVIVECPIGRSDHACISFYCNVEIETRIQRRGVYMFEQADYDMLRIKLDIDWGTFLDGGHMETKWIRFKAKIKEVTKDCVPIKAVKTNSSPRKRTNKELPMDKKLWMKIKRKKRLWVRIKEPRNYRDNNVQEMQVVVTEYRKINNQKYVQGKTSRKSGIPDLELANDKRGTHRTKNDHEKAEGLAEYFSEVFTKEPSGDIPRLPTKEGTKLERITFSPSRIRAAIKKLKKNKSAGPDEIHSRIIKEVGDVLVEPLKILFECSFESGQLPTTDWRLACITAIFKSGKQSDPGNYRPVSLTSIICKLMESIIREKIICHMKQNSYFSNKQFGFLSGRSTVLQLIKVLDDWTQALEERDAVDIIYCDFMKAFDKVPHRRFVEKEKSYNIGTVFSKWIEAFLSSRKQCVVVNGQESEWHNVMSGVPQGSEVSHGNYYMKEQLLEVEHEKDLGVIIDNRLIFSEHLNKKINMANKITGLIRRTFVSLDEVIFKQLYVALVRPHLEYANQAWAPFLVKDIEAIENVQRRATELVPTLKNLSYEERLRKLKIPTLAYRRARGDMLETFKILSGGYDPEVCQRLFMLRESDRTRGHSKRIYKKRTRLEKRKNSFCNRMINNWNMLPQFVVDSESTWKFENNIDKAWRDQDLLYNYRAKIIVKLFII
ncbi:uncharacterized protein [Palaemon carinicauda]|uniref:uncharacterized protein n=1 Tax=Palaemon carinicauda TaxID=392227 RepID=UPI0035B61C6F